MTSKLTLDGGATLFLEELHALPLVSIAIVLRSGAARDPRGKEGVARIMLRMLRRGCEGMTASTIEDTLDRLGAEMAVDASASSVAIHAQVIGRNLEPFILLLVRLLSTPTFPEDEFGRLQRETIADIIEIRDQDRALAHKAFRQTMFSGHPYGQSAAGSVASVEAVTLADVRRCYEIHLTRGNLVLGFAGDIDESEATRLGGMLVAAIKPGPPNHDSVPAPTATKGRRLVFVDKPDRTQTQILIGTLGTSPHDEDHTALGVANAIFGGTFTSRLMKEVRSKRGWSYGASSRLSIDRQRQSYSIWTFPKASDAAACIALELSLYEAFVQQGVTEKETNFIKRYLVRSHAFEIDTASKRLHQAIDVEVLSLPEDYHSGYVDHVKRVTAADASAAAKLRLSCSDLLFVVVGTASDILDDIKKAIPDLSSVDIVPFDRD